jgi:ligand-binding SRPBCC domain-containing protein
MPSVRLSFEVERAIGDVFEWHRDTRNAARISPPWLRVVSVEGRFPLERGDEVRMTVHPRLMPVNQRWVIRIDELTEPVLIVDRMLEGPFAFWRHEHRFEEIRPGRTRVTDQVDYRLAPSLVWAGPVARRVLLRTFAHRHRCSRELLKGSAMRNHRPDS